MAGAQKARGSEGLGGSGVQEGAGARRARHSRRAGLVGAAAAGVVVGGGGVGTVWVLTEQHAWNWPTLAAFTTSAGFGGLAALGAGTLAFAAAWMAASTSRANADADREQRERADRKEQWWKRAQWAMDLTLDEQQRQDVMLVGYDALTNLARSEWAEVHEAELIAAATERVLAMDDDGDGEPGEGGAEAGEAGDKDPGGVAGWGGWVGRWWRAARRETMGRLAR